MKVLTGKSGVTVLFRRVKSGVVDFRYYVQRGTADEEPNELGYCHAVEHMVFAGTPTKTWLDLNRICQEIGAEVNGQTFHNLTTYEITALKKYWLKSYEVLADMFYNCTFPEDRWEDIEKPAIVSETQEVLDNGTDLLTEELYSNGIGGRYHAAGSAEIKSIQQANVKDLVKIYNKYYHGSNILLLVTGDISERQLMSAVNKYDKLQVKLPTKRKKYNFKFNYAPIDIVREDSMHSYLQIIMPIGTPRRYKTKTALDLGVQCLSQYLYEELRENKGLVYGASADLSWDLPNNVFLNIETSTDPAATLKTKEALLLAVDNFQQNGLTAERINNIKTCALYSNIVDSEDIMESATSMWDVWEWGACDEDPHETYARVVDRLSVETIRNTTRLYTLGEKKFGKLVNK